jgi:hypothetical protein
MGSRGCQRSDEGDRYCFSKENSKLLQSTTVSGNSWLMRRLAFSITSALFLSACLNAQEQTRRPDFGDYPARRIFTGKPALPILSKGQRMFRTMIRQGANKPVEFAGHYTVPSWGCGTGCIGYAIVDSLTGRVYGPSGVSELPYSWEKEHEGQVPERMEFHPKSRLIKINGCPGERDCGFYDYLIVDGSGLKLLRRRLLPKQYQY